MSAVALWLAPLAALASDVRGRPSPVTGPIAPGIAASSALPLSKHDVSPRAVPGRLVVRYEDVVEDCVSCLIASGRSLASATGTDSLDRLNAELGVRSARPLFFRRDRLRSGHARSALRSRLQAVADRFPVRAARGRPLDEAPDLSNVYVLEISPELDPAAAARVYAADPSVAWAEPDFEVRASLVTDDPYLATSGAWGQSYGDLWGLHAIAAPAAWETANGDGTVIAIVDTGIDPSHPDIAANLWTNPGEIPGNGIDDDGNGYVDDVDGWDFVNDDADPLDRHGHGTHVAGTAAAVGQNALGVVGVAWGARVMAVKGLNDQGYGYTSDLAVALLYAAENGADVINNSWGGFGLSTAIYEAINVVDALGTVVVSAAGNDGLDIGDTLLWLPAGHPLGLTVGATMFTGDRAGFSNTGNGVSLVAPGVDVLSLRATHEVFSPSLVVGQRYLRLSGTSMATPHAAGAAAVLLSAAPTLTTEEVRWHLELAADQPGAPGYEGDRRNPLFGYGRLDAASMFADPPVTTRLTPPHVTEWHAFAGTSPVVPGSPGSFLFTTEAAVAWSIAAPPWLVATPSSGSGPAPLALQIDATALAPGSYSGTVDLAAPLAVDGGATFGATLAVHADARVGAPSVVGSDGFGTAAGYVPATVSNGVSTLVAWKPWGAGVPGIEYGMVDGAGGVTGPVPATTRPAIADVSAASDGHGFLLAWLDFSIDQESVRFARVRADGTLIDTEPVEVLSRIERPCTFYELVGAGWDGDSYWLGVVERKYCSGISELSVFRVRPDGSFDRKTRVEKLKTGIYGEFRCKPGRCLFAWLDVTPEGTDAYGKYVRGGWALPLAGATPLSEPRKILNDLWIFTDLETDGSDFLALAQRIDFCAVGDLCRTHVITTRIGGDGEPLDIDGTVVSNADPGARLFPWPGGIAWDGDAWVASYGLNAVSDSPFENGSYLFTNRLDALGAPLSTEPIGDLVDDGGRASESFVAATATHSLVVWEDGRDDPLLDPPYGHPAFSHHLAQRVVAHEPGAAYPDRALGTIGTLAIAEGGKLAFRATAPGVDPGAAVFSASGLPPGAVFDPATHLFQWKPAGDQAGTYGGVHIEATDGVATASETFAISVQPAVRTLAGRVQLADGTPVAHAALDVRGSDDKHRTIVADDDGRYRLEGAFAPGRALTIRLTPAMRKRYKTAPPALRVVAPSGDAGAPDLIAIPR
ncbi:MAG TPA: S8 family serine peptidase [Candidatus Binatia bacterium]|nr:S8 family serine peptidase [Candidatus Binatia bacterium]